MLKALRQAVGILALVCTLHAAGDDRLLVAGPPGRPGGRLVLLCLNQHQQHEVTARYGERHPGFSPRAVRNLLSTAGLDVKSSEIAAREAKKPHLEVVLAIGEKPQPPAPAKPTSQKLS